MNPDRRSRSRKLRVGRKQRPSEKIPTSRSRRSARRGLQRQGVLSAYPAVFACHTAPPEPAEAPAPANAPRQFRVPTAFASSFHAVEVKIIPIVRKY